MSTLKRMIQEAHRRSLRQVLAAYAVASWEPLSGEPRFEALLEPFE